MKLFLSLLFSIISIIVIAQDSIPSFSPDRPGQTTGTYIVPKGYFHIETGTSFSSIKYKDFNNEITSLQFNTTLIRYGLFENFELRLGSGFEKVSFQQNGLINYSYINNGFTPIIGGMKIKVFEGKGYIPRISFLGQLTWPYFADKEESNDLLYPLFAFCFSNSINAYISLSYNFGIHWNNYVINNIGLFTNGFYSVAICVSPFDKFSFFVEPFGSFNRLENAVNQVDYGISYLILPNLQIDLYSIPDFQFKNTDQVYFAGGISWRLPR